MVEDLEVVADDMTVFAGRTADQDRATVVTMFRHAVAGAVAAGLAGEGDLIRGLLFAALTILLLIACVCLRIGRPVGEGLRGAGIVADGEDRDGDSSRCLE